MSTFTIRSNTLDIPDILRHILSFIDMETRASACLVSKFWREQTRAACFPKYLLVTIVRDENNAKCHDPLPVDVLAFKINEPYAYYPVRFLLRAAALTKDLASFEHSAVHVVKVPPSPVIGTTVCPLKLMDMSYGGTC